MNKPVTVEEFETLYRTRYREYLRVAKAIAGDEDRAADAVHDAFARAIRGRETFRGDAPLEAWVWRIVINAARATRPRRPTEEASATEGTDEQELLPDPYGVRTWIHALPEQQRLIVFLRYFTDLDYQSIAAALSVKVGTVSATLHAAHAALRRSMEEVQS